MTSQEKLSDMEEAQAGTYDGDDVLVSKSIPYSYRGHQFDSINRDPTGMNEHVKVNIHDYII
jgi:hypothetical protein